PPVSILLLHCSAGRVPAAPRLRLPLEEEKNPAVFKKKRREKRMGSKNNGAHTERLVPYLLPCLEQAIPRLLR
ncbi:hypothetical protein JOQ06_025206, partial [Pogonophryne albipinna]